MSGTNEIRVTNAKTGGEKGSKDENLALLPWEQLLEVGRLYNFGAKKYSPNNWMKGYDWSLSFSSLMRHAAAWWNGEFDDDETNCDHMTSVVFHALALMYFRKHHPDLDDRPCTTLAATLSVPGHVSGEAAVEFPLSDDDVVRILANAKAALPVALRSLVRLTVERPCDCDATTYCHECRPDLYETRLEITPQEATLGGHRRDIVTAVKVDPALEGSEYRLSGSDSAPETGLEATTTLDDRSEPLSRGLAGASGHHSVNLCSPRAAELPRSATITQQITCSLDEYRQIKALLEV